ncbi:hypothetical protein [Streptomyces sp. NPDC000931]|uniref:hypothetical protein n=1 Tax=Streptomyces sp. NPDC000931 TaxID=3154372 RepID=UPI003332FB11
MAVAPPRFTGRLAGRAGGRPTLRDVVAVGTRFESLDRLEVLEVVEEVTPWEDVEAPETLAGLTDQQ